jgi:hypothetical protein
MRFGALTTVVFLLVAVQSMSPAASQQAPQDHAAKWAAMFQSQVGRCWKKLDSSAELQTANVAFEIRLSATVRWRGRQFPKKQLSPLIGARIKKMLPARSSNVSPTSCLRNITTSGNILCQCSSLENLLVVERVANSKSLAGLRL